MIEECPTGHSFFVVMKGEYVKIIYATNQSGRPNFLSKVVRWVANENSPDGTY
jgi:hypothetical protein